MHAHPLSDADLCKHSQSTLQKLSQTEHHLRVCECMSRRLNLLAISLLPLSIVIISVQESRPRGGLHELSLLATLIKPNATKASNFKLNLFGDTNQPPQDNVGASCLMFNS